MPQLELPLDNDFSRHPLFADLAPHIVSAFKMYHAQNPRVYEMFKTFSRSVRLRGFENYSAAAILQRIRWHSEVEATNSDDIFKVNNNYHPCYARLLMVEDPVFVGFFRTRHTPGTVNPFEEYNPPD